MKHPWRRSLVFLLALVGVALVAFFVWRRVREDRLIADLASEDRDTRIRAAEALAELRAGRAFEPMLNAIEFWEDARKRSGKNPLGASERDLELDALTCALESVALGDAGDVVASALGKDSSSLEEWGLKKALAAAPEIVSMRARRRIADAVLEIDDSDFQPVRSSGLIYCGPPPRRFGFASLVLVSLGEASLDAIAHRAARLLDVPGFVDDALSGLGSAVLETPLPAEARSRARVLAGDGFFSALDALERQATLAVDEFDPGVAKHAAVHAHDRCRWRDALVALLPIRARELAFALPELARDGFLDDPAVVAVAFEALRDASFEVRRDFLLALLRYGIHESALLHLLYWCRSIDVETRLLATAVIWRIDRGAERAIDQLLTALDASVSEVDQYCILDSLALLGGDRRDVRAACDAYILRIVSSSDEATRRCGDLARRLVGGRFHRRLDDLETILDVADGQDAALGTRVAVECLFAQPLLRRDVGRLVDSLERQGGLATWAFFRIYELAERGAKLSAPELREVARYGLESGDRLPLAIATWVLSQRDSDPYAGALRALLGDSPSWDRRAASGDVFIAPDESGSAIDILFDVWRKVAARDRTESSVDRVGETLFYALQEIGPLAAPLVPELVELLRHRRWPREAAAVLVSIGAPSVPAILELLASEKDRVTRGWAIDALGRSGAAAAIPALEAELSSPHPALRDAASIALSHIALDDAEALAAMRRSRHPLAARFAESIANNDPEVLRRRQRWIDEKTRSPYATVRGAPVPQRMLFRDEE